MFTNKDLLTNLKIELGELHGNIIRLREFRDDDEFNKIDINHQILLLKQLKAMMEYEEVLEQRIDLIESEE